MAAQAAQEKQEAETVGEGDNAANQNAIPITGNESGAENDNEAVHAAPPGITLRPGVAGAQAKKKTNGRRRGNQNPVDRNEPLRPFVPRPRASLDANLAAAYAHARRRARIEQQQREKEERERLGSMSRISTTDCCMHATQEQSISSNTSGSNNETKPTALSPNTSEGNNQTIPAE
ncbi:hypothetical protein ACSSS7_002066 [Eimeria intestinalis]